MNKKKIVCLMAGLAVALLFCSIGIWFLINKKQSNHSDRVSVYWSSAELAQDAAWFQQPQPLSSRLSKQEDLKVTKESTRDITTIQIYPDHTSDPFLGIGTSLEESTVYNILQLSDEKKKEFVYNLVDPVNGAGMTLFRMAIGTPDFTGQKFYTYYDGKTLSGQPNWYPENGEDGFSIQKDIDYGITEIAKLVMEAADHFGVSDQVHFFSSPWSPPGWMKEETDASKSYPDNELLLKGGRLKDSCIDDLAEYLTRYTEEYAKLGIPIYALTLQNEPMLEINYPSCLISAEQEGRLAAALKESLQNSEILKEQKIAVPLIWAFDHNAYDLLSYMNELCLNPAARDAIDGAAVHDYYGELGDMQRLKDLLFNRTGKTVHLTERAVWGTEGADRIIQYFRNGAVSYNSWVAMLDSNKNYMQWTGEPSVTMFVRKAESNTEYWPCPEYYIMGNFGRFIRPGYVRMESDYGDSSTITNVVYGNPEDGTITAVAVNQTSQEQTFRFVYNGKQIEASLPSGHVATYVWQEDSRLLKKEADQAGSDGQNKTRTADESKAIAVDGAPVELSAELAYDRKGSFTENTADGDYMDFLLDVKKAGAYSLTCSVTLPSGDSGVAMAWQIISGKSQNPAELGSDTALLSIPAFWGTQQLRKAAVLEEGLQTIRFQSLTGGFSIDKIELEQKPAITVLETGVTIDAKAFYDAANVHAIENEETVGYMAAGSLLDYPVEVKASGNYTVSIEYSYADNPADAPRILLQSVMNGKTTELGAAETKATGAYNIYKPTEPVEISLPEDAFTLRLKLSGNGVNLKQIIIK